MIRLENVIQSFKSATSNFRAFLHDQQWREALIFLFFVFLSFGFWILQSLQEEYEISINIPIRYRNLPPDITFTQTPPDKITARVRDRGSILLNYSFGRTFASIDVNMKNTSGAAGSLQVRKQDVESEISKQLINTTHLQSFEPQEINVEYSQRAHKTVPVLFDGIIYPEEGYAISGELTITPNQVEAFSNKEVIDTLTVVKTTYTEIKNANKTINRIIQLHPQEGTNFEPNMVTITIPIEEFTEKTFEIPVQFRRVPIDQIVRAFPSVIKVNAFVPLSHYKDLTEDDFGIMIDYKDLEENDIGSIPISLTQKPAWVENVTLSPDRIEFIFEQIRPYD